jgi:hypothetical protein
VAAALLRGDAETVASASAELQQAAQNVMGLLGTSQARALLQDGEMRQRLNALAQQVAWQREACIRRGGAVERSLEILVPGTRSATYAPGATASRGASAYGRATRQTGAFKALAA